MTHTQRGIRELIFTEPLMVVTDRLAYKISRAVNLTAARQGSLDAELRDALVGIEVLARQYESSTLGTNDAKSAELGTDSITTTQAASIAKVTTRAIRKAIAENRLEAELVGTVYLITRANLRTYMNNRT